MPDLFVHSSFILILVKYFSRYLDIFRKDDFILIFLWGNMLPDLITRPFLLLLPGKFIYYHFLHFPVPQLFICAILYEMILKRYKNSKKYLIIMFIGVFLHNILDCFQKHVSKIHYLFFPFYNKDISIGLFYPSDSVYFSAIFSFIFILYFSFKILKIKK